jgi:DNA polymerase I-like protein with 3'-5' exonuclease and polymerase domains
MGLTPKKTTAKGKPSVDEEALEETAQESQLVQDILRIRKLEKIRGTYLSGWERETGPDHILRPFYNLHIVRTYRSSCSSPDLQNVTIRDKVAQKITRRAIYPRAGHVLVEADYSGIEVRTSACYHRDPNMITYIMDPSTDMHRDTAMECFLLDLEEVSKPARQGAKNQFVFAEFYGSYWRNTGVGLWKWAENCTTAQNVSLITHLKKKGIRSLGDPADRRPTRGTFLYHIREVEKRFWGERFRVYAQWKEEFWQQYLEQGEFYTLTGFRCTGPMAKNNVVNYPIQGSAFHCLLRSKYNTKNWIASRGYENDILPCGQIHDSGLFSVNPELLPEFAKAIHYIWGEQLRKEWPWIIVPLEVEVETTPVDGSWFLKGVYHEENM